MTEDERRFLWHLAWQRIALLEARILEDKRFGPMKWIGKSETPEQAKRRQEIHDREIARLRGIEND